MSDPLVVTGRLVTFDDAQPVIDDGALYIGADEKIAAVQARSDPAPAGFETAARLQTGGNVYPGLIDLHGHMVYNALSLWSPPGRKDPYTTRYQWPKDHSYEGLVSDPANALGALAGKAMLKYVEVKAVIGGVTAVQGSAKMAYPYEGWLVRNIEYETFKTGKKTVFQSALPLRTDADYAKQRQHMLDGGAFIYHVSEGTDPELISEYEKLRDQDCLHPTFIAIHCTALTADQYKEWAPRGGSIVWSPFSNVWLYRDTTKVVDARDAGMRICLGSDWSPSGSKNLLGELKVAQLWNAKLGNPFSARELCEMTTCNPADALGWGDRLGRLKVGLHGDFLVTSDRGGDPYANLVTSRERDVLFVAINGQPFYGTNELMAASGSPNVEPIEVGGMDRSIRLVYPGIKDADWTWRQVLDDIAAAKADPVKRYLEIEKLHQVGKPPPWLMTDKPWDDPQHTGKEVPVTVEIPPLDPLVHDASYFDAIDASPIQGGLLGPIRKDYS